MQAQDDQWNARIFEALKPHVDHELTIREHDPRRVELICKTCDAWVMWSPPLEPSTS